MMEDFIKRDIQSIRSDCFELRHDFDYQLQQLYERINQVEQAYLNQQIQKEQEPKVETVVTTHVTEHQIDDFVFERKEETIIEEKVIHQFFDEKTPEEEVTIVTRHEKKVVVQQPPKPSFLLTNSLTQTILDVVFPPFQELSSFFSETYQHYKAENKLPVFFMTLAGIVIMLFGFGFLAQYAVVNYADSVNQWVKLGIGMTITSAVLSWAIRLVSKSEKFKEFGSALVGLTIITNYLFIYFLCESSGFSILQGFLLIVVNTILALGLALRYETRIVAILSLIGGACVPFYLPFTGGTELYFYFGFLFLLTLSAVYTAHQILWKVLQNVAFFISLGMIEYFVFSIDTFTNKGIYAIIFHAFAYLFFFISLWDGKKIKQTLDKEAVFMIAANIGLFITNLYFVYEDSNYDILGYLYLINTIPALAVLITSYAKIEKEIRLLLIVLIGAFVAVAIPALFESHLMGITWGIEACVLLYCGFIFNFSEVRKQAYVLLAAALGKMLYTVPVMLLQWNVALFNEGYWNLVAFGLIILAVIVIYFLNKNKVEDRRFDAGVIYLLLEIEAVWSAILVFSTSYYYLNEWTFTLAIPYFLVIIYVANKPFFLKIAELWSIAGIGLTLFLAYYFSLASSHIDFFAWKYLSFSMQTMYAKVVIIQFLAILWGLQWYYERVSPKNNWIYLAKGLRILFYLFVPFIVLDVTYKMAPNYLITLLWLSVLVSFILHELARKRILLVAFYVWVFGVSFIVGAILFIDNLYNQTMLPSIVGLGVLLAIYLYKKAYLEENSIGKYRLVNAYLYHYLAIFTGLVANALDVNLLIITSSICLYYFVLTLLQNRIYVLHKSILFFHRLTLIAFTLHFLLLFDAPNSSEQVIWFLLSSVSLGLIGYMVYEKERIYSTKPSTWKIDIYWFHVVLVAFYWAVTSVITLNEFNLYFTILLFVHAIVILFTSLKNYKVLKGAYITLFVVALLKLFFIDLEGFALVEKVIVFIVIGAILLGSSFLFLKFKKD